MEFYKLVYDGVYRLEEEAGQPDILLHNRQLSQLAQALYSCYKNQDALPLRFRKYIMAYYHNGENEYVALAEAERLKDGPLLDGFASTWLDGEEENRVWIGSDGNIENRGPSTGYVHDVLERLISALQEE